MGLVCLLRLPLSMEKRTIKTRFAFVSPKKERRMKIQRGFTLIELMVVIVIIGILSALAVPKMFGTSAKAKAAEAPGVIAHWETLESVYAQETNKAGCYTDIGFIDPSGTSKWFSYLETCPSGATATLQAITLSTFGDCAAGDYFQSDYNATGDNAVHTSNGNCQPSYVTNF
jgi:type IV pilus assembly protein PilA